MKIMFTVQGDGRGHMTQAIATSQMLQRHGHDVVAVTVGTNPSRALPEFFVRTFEDRLHPLASAGFCFQAGRGVAALATARQAAAGLGAYRQSLAILQKTIERSQPDLIINFLEPLTGVLNLLRPHPIPVISVGHQFMLDHPEFVRCSKYALQQWTMRRYIALAGARSTKLALSFYPAAQVPQRRLVVGPPLLREQVFELSDTQSGRFLLAYVLNQGYAEDILRWHAAFPDVELHCFCERPKVEPVWRYDHSLFFHKLDGAKFLRMMAQCRGVACTAGFESLTEAAWFGKPLLVVPVANHVEQYLNALDAQKAGLALTDSSFDLTPLLRGWKPANLQAYRRWLRQAEAILMSVIEKTSYKPLRAFVPSAVRSFSPVARPIGLVPNLPESHCSDISCDTLQPAVSTREVAIPG